MLFMLKGFRQEKKQPAQSGSQNIRREPGKEKGRLLRNINWYRWSPEAAGAPASRARGSSGLSRLQRQSAAMAGR